MTKWKIVYYINQFFGQYGGEDVAGMGMVVRNEAIGPALNFQQSFGEQAEIVSTIICGDNYFNEHREDAENQVLKILEEYQPDMVVAGPAFSAGRYGVACGTVCALAEEKFGIPAITGMYPENPGVIMFRSKIYIIQTSNHARTMTKEITKMVSLSKKILNKQQIGNAKEEGTILRGLVRNVRCEKKGTTRAIDMLLKKVRNEPFETETPMEKFDQVEKAPAIKDLSKATIAIATDGGLYPVGNPDKMPFINSNRYAPYYIGDKEFLDGRDYCILHRGYDNEFVLESPDRLVPVDSLKMLEKEKVIGKMYPYFLSTTGLNTSLENSKIIAENMIKRLKEDGVDGVILTST